MGGRGSSSGGGGKFKVASGASAKVGDRVTIKGNETGSRRERMGALSFWEEMANGNVSKYGAWEIAPSFWTTSGSSAAKVVKATEKALKIEVPVSNWRTDATDTWEIWMPRKAFD